MAAKKSFGQLVLLNLKKKWIQVFLCFVALCVAHWATAKTLGPKDTAKGSGKESAGFNYLHCPECKFEMPFQKDQEGKTCARCKPPKVGYYTPTKESIKKGGDGNPWKRYNVAMVVEGLVFLGLIYYLLSRPVEPPPTEFFINCIHCGMALKYKPEGCDQYAICAGCEQVIKLPDEDEAMTNADQEAVKEESMLTVLEMNLRDSGHIVDAPVEGEEQPSEQHGPGTV